MTYLAGLKDIELLQLNRTGITDSGLAQIRGLMRLQYLSLDGNQITDSGLLNLQGLMLLDTWTSFTRKLAKRVSKN